MAARQSDQHQRMEASGNDGSGIGGSKPRSYHPHVSKPRPLYGDLLKPTQRRNDDNGEHSPSTLVVGPEVHLKGEIDSCDTLVVLGRVEATLSNRRLEIAEGGQFVGQAVVDTAVIAGRFEGSISVRYHLIVHESGEIYGSIRYGRLAVDEGGVLSGDVQLLDEHGPASGDPTAMSQP